ncbi:glycosyltransferase family 4 protein [Flavobacterium sp.]|jgi:glycosyltransferase involved in cell wall biosynthesis|uniref:glycosyltransferase family 4 protein n=1 Tax=Flavobacterium sp. TaxID=239 RepID=UPI00391AA6ED
MSETRKKLVRITTVPLSLDKILDGQLAFMNNHYEVIAVSSEKEYLIRCAKNEGVRFKHIEMTRKITPIKDFISLIKLISFLKKERPLIIHSHTPKAGILAMLASKITNIPIRLHTVAGLPLMEEKGSKKKLLELIEKLTYSFSTFVFTNSNGLYKYIIENNYVSKNKLKVIGNGSSNGVDINYFSPTSVSVKEKEKLKLSLGILENDFTFVFVGRIVADKGINELINAFDTISFQNNAIKLLLVGEQESHLDPLNENTLKLISSNKNIIKTGFQKDIRPFLAVSDALVFPSYREGFPNVIMQAGAMELPVIATNINGCNEIIINEKNGVLIELKNNGAIVKAMVRLIEDEAFYKNLKSNARSMIVSRFERKVICEKILYEYKEMEKVLNYGI